jgi:putative tricarboxylic transport membrane protein
MEIVDNLSIGILSVFTTYNLLYCLIGVTLGTLIGILPGLGPFAAISILLPVTYYLDPISGIVMLAGIYYGTQYGGSTTSILLNLPGESASVVTTIDGYQMSKQGRAGEALSISAIGSFVAGIVSTIIVAGLAVPLSNLGTKFGPAEYTSLMILGLIASVTLSKGSILKSLSMVCLGILIGTIGIDINSGIERFTFEISYLYDGISFAIIAMGMFGMAEIIYNLLHTKSISLKNTDIKNLYPSKENISLAFPSIARGTAVGSILGILPGVGAIISSFASYSIEKNISKTPEKFGNGAIEGVAGPESANNAAAQTSFIPMLSLGIPTTPVMALLLSALLIHDISPGPAIISENSTLFWTLIVSMLVGNFFLIVLNLPLIGLWIKILQIPRSVLYTVIILFGIVGVYYISNSFFNILLLSLLTVLGYFFKKWECEPAPLAMGFVIGSMLEEYMRRALMISNGSWTAFVVSPISLTLLLISAGLLIFSCYKRLQKN